MKRLKTISEPQVLVEFRTMFPAHGWEHMRHDGQGRHAYEVIRRKLNDGQGGLCAFCEVGIHGNDPLKCCVEHFHPKSDVSDTSATHNWAMDWENMLAVCRGGSQRHQAHPYMLEPLEENLSCDAFKDKMIQSGRLQEKCEGWVINPRQMPAFPRLFFLEKSTGRLLPDLEQCADFNFVDNNHPCTGSLVQHTIDMLNLNCDRLCEARLRVVWDIERNKKRWRERGVSSQQGFSELADRYFRQNWPGFFTTIRFCLGHAAEQYLVNTGFQG